MSKVGAQQALREARYLAQQAEMVAARPTVPTVPTPTVTTTTPAARAAEPEPATERTGETQTRCGHRSIGSKSCQRLAGHTEKSHRYK